MQTNVSFREINVENPQTGPKTASTAFFSGEWLMYASGKLAPLTPGSEVVGLCITPVPSTDATTDLITFDGINVTEDRFVMPVANGSIPSNPIGLVGDVYSDFTSLDASTIDDGGVQFKITQVIKAVADSFGPALVEVAVVDLSLAKA